MKNQEVNNFLQTVNGGWKRIVKFLRPAVIISAFVFGMVLVYQNFYSRKEKGSLIREPLMKSEIPEKIPGEPTQPLLPEQEKMGPEEGLNGDFREGPELADLDVVYIERTPRYYRYCVEYLNNIPRLCPGTENQKRWPKKGEPVTYTAHIKNKGGLESPAFDYQWLENGVVVAEGQTLQPLDPAREAIVERQTIWSSSPETIEFRVDPQDLIPETIKMNNFLAVNSHDLTISIWVEQGLYDIFNRTLNLVGSYSFEDWVQAQLAKMNERFAQAKYSVSPDGMRNRVRVDKIVVAQNLDGGDSPMNSDPHFYLIDMRWQFKDNDAANNLGEEGIWQNYTDRFVQDVDWGFIYEVTHQLGVIDLYRMNLADDPGANMRVQVKDIHGNVIPASHLPTFAWDQILFEDPGIMGGGSTSPYKNNTYYSSHTAAGLNSNYGHRRGYYGEYLFDIPADNYLKIVDVLSNPVVGAEIRLFQKDMYTEYIDNTPEITGTTDGQGRIHLTNRSVEGVTTATGHTLRKNPFGQIDVAGTNGVMLVQVFKDSREAYDWLKITDFNLAYWSGQKDSATFIIQTDL